MRSHLQGIVRRKPNSEYRPHNDREIQLEHNGEIPLNAHSLDDPSIVKIAERGRGGGLVRDIHGIDPSAVTLMGADSVAAPCCA